MKAILDETSIINNFIQAFGMKDRFLQRRSIEKNLILSERAGIEPIKTLYQSLNIYFNSDRVEEKKSNNANNEVLEYKCTCNRTFRTMKALNGHGYKNCKRSKL